MKTGKSLGSARLIVLALLAAGLLFCGVDAILSDAVTTPSKVGDGVRVQGTDTVFIGAGWILMGLGLAARVILDRRDARAGTVVAIALVALGGLFWLVVL